jgi:peptidoglycan/LPS O-acetylase OafA/YrhL
LVVSGSLALLAGTLTGRSIQFSLVAFAAVSFVYLSLFSRQSWLQALLANPFLVYTGTISYGIYLLEKIPLDVGRGFLLDRHPILVFPVTAACTYGLAALSWHLLEKPFLKLKRLFVEADFSEVQAGELTAHVVR